MNDNHDANWFCDTQSQDDPFAEVPFEVPEESAAGTVAGSTEAATLVEGTEKTATETSAAAQTVPEETPKTEDVGNSTQPTVTAEETAKRAAHEAAEAQRKAEFDARQAEKKRVTQEQIAKVQAMSDDEVMAAAIQRAAADTEKLTRRNMMEMVTEYIQTLSIEDPAFARLTMHPRKSMVRCFQYISRKAYEYVQDEMKANGTKYGPDTQAYGSDIPDDVCYQWAEDYFRDPTVKEDQEEEEKFVPKAYGGKTAVSAKGKKAPAKSKDSKKDDAQKASEKRTKHTEDDQAAENGQISMFGGL